MQLKDFLAIAEECDARSEEIHGFAILVDQYWDARRRGEPGLKQEDVEPHHVEFLLQLFEFDAGAGVYMHPSVETLLAKVSGQKANTEAQFEAFWKLYPRKVAKAAARKVWVRLVKTDTLAKRVTNAMVKHAGFYEWLSKEPQFIPHAATWLSQQRWEDELPTAATTDMRGVF